MSMDHFRLFPDDTDPLLRYKADAERRERELAAERKREERDERRAGLRSEIEGLRSELQALRAEMDRRSDMHFDVVGQAIGEYLNRIFDHVDGRVKGVEHELYSLIEQRFAALEAKIAQARADVLAADGKPRKDFRFASEKTAEGDGEPLDLPPCSKARGLN